MGADFLERCLEIFKLLGRVACLAPLKISHKGFHPLQASFIKRLKNVERRKQKCARTTSRVQYGYSLNCLPESPEQVWPFAALNHVLRELSDIQIKGDEFINLVHFTCCKLGAHLGIAGAAGHNFAPNFRG